MRNGLPLGLLLVLAVVAPAAADPAPAYLVKDLNTAAVEESDSTPLRFVTRDGVAYFTATDGLHGAELWRSDGTAAGTRMVVDINPGNDPSNPRDLTVIGDAVWFRAWDGRHGCGIWRSDGTEAGTQNIAVLHTSWPYCYDTYTDGTPAGFIQINDTVFFVANTSELGRELWRSDGTKRPEPAWWRISIPTSKTPIRARSPCSMACSISSPTTGLRATSSGVRTVRPTAPDACATSTQAGDGIQSGRTTGRRRAPMAVVNGALLFAGYDEEHGVELWRSDGTEDGTKLLVDTEPGTAVSGPGCQPFRANAVRTSGWRHDLLLHARGSTAHPTQGLAE